MKTIHDDVILQQCIFESNQWARLLSFLKQENAYCKSRLAEVVATIEGDGNLIEAEEFNDQFLSQDSMIDFLANEIKKHNKLLEKELYMHAESLKELIKNQRILNRNIQNAEDIFSKTKRSFTVYLLSLL